MTRKMEEDARRLYLWATVLTGMTFLGLGTGMLTLAAGTGTQEATEGLPLVSLAYEPAPVLGVIFGLTSASMYAVTRWTSSSDVWNRKVLIGYLVGASLLAIVPSTLIGLYSVYSPGKEGIVAMLLIGSSLVAALLVGIGRNRLTGPRLYVGCSLPAAALLVFLYREAGGFNEGLAAAFMFSCWFYILTGLLLQYPSMLWYAWKTPVEEWGSGDAPTEEASTEAVRFESVQDIEEA